MIYWFEMAALTSGTTYIFLLKLFLQISTKKANDIDGISVLENTEIV